MEIVSKKDIVAHLEANNRMPPEAAEKTIDLFLEFVRREVLMGKQIVLPHFATLMIVEKKAQIVKDPETGHQYISPAENVISFHPDDEFKEKITKAKLSSIILAVPQNDPFARVVEFHFSRVGWRVHIVNSAEQCLEYFKTGGAYLVIVDYGLDGANTLIEHIKANRETSLVPLIVLYPSGFDPDKADIFQVMGDEHLVEPFEVYTLLRLAESELARSSEEEVIFDQQVSFQFSSREDHVERGIELAKKLCEGSGLDDEGLVAMHAAMREAIGNAAQHGNKFHTERMIRVLFLLDRTKVTVVVTDDGPGFDHRRFVNRQKSAVDAARDRIDEGRLGGLGIMLMQKCADEVEYNDAGNRITLTKYLPGRSRLELQAPVFEHESI